MKQIVYSAVAALVLSSAVQGQLAFRFTYSGATLGNSATAEGTITFTPGNPQNPGQTPFNVSLGGYISDLSITVSDASAGNGTFGLSDFGGWAWNSGANGTVVLDLATELVGQDLGNGYQWGDPADPNDDSTGDLVGDFSLFADLNQSPAAPHGTWYFTLTTDGGNGDKMLLTSFAPVPEPRGWALLTGTALLGLAAWRRRRARG